MAVEIGLDGVISDTAAVVVAPGMVGGWLVGLGLRLARDGGLLEGKGTYEFSDGKGLPFEQG